MSEQKLRGFRLSLQQNRLWSLQKDCGGYLAQCAILIEGELDEDVLKNAVQRVIDRHEILRTSFRRPRGLQYPVQVVADNWHPDWKLIEFQATNDLDEDTEIDCLLTMNQQDSFDAEQNPASRFSLVRLALNRHVVTVIAPAMVADEATMRIFFDEVVDAYEALMGVNKPNGESLQYAAYAAWQSESLGGENAKLAQHYWRAQDVTVCTDITHPLTLRSEKGAQFRPEKVDLEIEPSVARQIDSLARQNDRTPALYYLACWFALLVRTTQSSKVAVAYRADGREHVELQGVMGPFARFIPLRCDCDMNAPFSQFVAEIAKVMGGARDWEQYFDWEQERDSDGDDNAPAFLPFAFEFTRPKASRQSAGICFSVCHEYACSDRFHLKLSCHQNSETSAIGFYYDSQLFSQDDIESLARQYNTMLQSAVNHPDAFVAELDILDQNEQHRVLVEFNGANTEFPKENCVHELFEKHASLTPDRCAVWFEDEMLTYGELNLRANDIAIDLRELGVAAGVPVGICVARSIDMIVGILGILKAGGAYVPIDPSLPPQRMDQILAESQVKALLTQRPLVESLPTIAAQVIVLDERGQKDATTIYGNCIDSTTPANLVYAIFTSGSTGASKGVVVEHRQLVNYVHSVAAMLDVSGGEHFATVSTLAADLGNTSIFGALCTGGSLHVVSQERLSDPDAMADYFATRQIDCLKIVPSHLDALMSAAHPEHLVSCRRLIVGGEASRRDLIERIEKLSPDCQIFNHYGPTETTIGAVAFRMENGNWDDSATLPIGRPLANYRSYLLDANLKPVPVGVAGELFLGGEGVARGYLNRPDLTAERFVPNAFGEISGARCYQTGDLARYLRNGNLEFLGRVDHQVKIRGYRIELGEIETILTQHSQVRESAVNVREDIPGDKRLAAYVVLGSGEKATTAELRGYLEDRLPDYMIPAAFMVLKQLPLNRNGKLDRKALPAPEQMENQLATETELPRTPTEERLAKIWADLLHLERVSIHDDFFALGGHSLLAMQLVSRVRKVFQMELALLSIFEAPTVAGLAEQIDQDKGLGQSLAPSAIEPVSRSGHLPVSFSQERLWLFDQLQPGSHAYNVPVAVRLAGPLDANALNYAVNEILRRHEVLRTVFDAIDGSPLQVVAKPSNGNICIVDLRGLGQTQLDNQVKTLVEVEARRPFELSCGPLWRARLLQIADQEHVVLWTQHHITTDGWSSAIFVQEIASLYTAFSEGRPSDLAELSVQYADFSVWQRTWLQDESIQKQVSYWKEKLFEAPPALELPTDRPRPAVQSFRGGVESTLLCPKLSRGLINLSQDENATTFMTLLAAFNSLIYLHSGQEDIVVGSPIAGRNQVETEGLIGFFLNTLALRTNVDGGSSFRQLLQTVRQGVVEAMSNQDVPFEMIVDELKIKRESSRTALYQVMFNMQKAGGKRLVLHNLQVSPLFASEHASKFDLTLYATEATEAFELQMVYNADLFDAATIKQLLEHFGNLLQAAVNDPDQRISSMPVLSPDNRAKRRTTGSSLSRTGGFVEFAREDIELSIADRFQGIVDAYPHRTAVKTKTHEWNYEKLNNEANRVAYRILALSKESDRRVGLLCKSDAPLMSGLLGALKAQATYVPLDPSNPRERLAFMLKHSRASAILTDSLNESTAHELATKSIQVINVEDDAVSNQEATEELQRILGSGSPDAMAYILYTSGSTGRPKGVMQNHRNVLHFMQVYTNNLGIRKEDRLSLLSSYGFDGAVMDIFGALLNGATLCPMNLREESLDDVVEWISDQQISIFHSTPTVYRQLFANLAERTTFPKIRTVVLGGEEALAEDLSLFKQRFSTEAVFVNGLGPSESTVTIQHFMDSKTDIRRRSLPIGDPVLETDVLLLDRAGEPVEVYGEIAVRSPHVALGYWQDPQTTQAAFLPDPTGGNRRTYRTGDMGRRLPDGSLEFVGRKDSQVKIRGFRVELGEIEAVMSQHPDVGDCAVLARVNGSQQMKLVAYAQPAQQCDLAANDLRKYLSEKLPDYMMPAAFMILDALPLTPNGKLDRGKLPEPEQTRSTAEETFVSPRTPFEEIVAGLWIDVLELPQVGVHDNFFDLGGHSLMAMRFLSRIRDTFKIELPLRALFESPTVEGVAKRLEAAKRNVAGSEVSVPVLELADRSGELPLSFAQQRMWLLDQLEPGNYAYNLSAAINLAGALSLNAIEQSLGEIVNRHEVLRTTFGKSKDGRDQQIIGPVKPWTLTVVDLGTVSADRRDAMSARLANSEAQRPFSLDQGPLLRVTLLSLGELEHVALFTMHHIVSDGWSIGVFVRELSELYHDFCTGNPSRFEPLPIQYADFTHWQRRWLQGEVLETQLDYWRRQLHDAPSQLELPLDRPRPAVQTYRGAKAAFGLSDEVVESLRQLSRDQGSTLFMTLLAAFQTLLHRYTGQYDIVVGAPIAGRTLPESEELIGFFVNTLVLRNHLDGDLTFRQCLEHVRESVLEAIAHQDLPFEKLVDDLQPTRDMSHSPLFQVAMVLQNAPQESLAMPGLTFKQMESETQSSKFDWMLAMTETDNGLSGKLEYNTDLFDAATAKRVLCHFETLIGSILVDPDQLISDLPLLDDLERDQLLVDWNDTQSAYRLDALLHELIEEQVEKCPDAVAVVFEDCRLTYRELNDRSNQLAWRLRSQGVGPEVLVGVCMERSVELVVGLLGVLKAGGAYLPLDPEYPESRLRMVLEDANPVLLLTHQRLAENLPRDSVPIFCLDGDWDVAVVERRDHLCSGVTAGNAAYVIYTSGSTGRPKGVLNTHEGICNRLQWMQETYELSGADQVLQKTPATFDVSVWEFFWPLMTGASLVMARPGGHRDPAYLMQTIAEERITTLHFVPSMLHSFFNSIELPLPDVTPLRRVVCSGEALPYELKERFLNGLSGVELHNLYGPTEAAIDVTATACHLGGDLPTVSIGRPVANTQVYVLDRHHQAVPVGVSGELHIGGVQLARIYLGRPELTAEKFIPNPFAAEPGGRLYRTGDLCRYLADGNIDFQGRLDHQVKVRGFRIELGEIESVLAQHAGVQEVIVLAREDRTDDKRLVAYLRTGSDSPNVSQLRGYLKEQLPDYMVPSSFVMLESFPLTPNGKVNRRALPAPEQTRPELEAALVVPRNETEERLARIWCEVLDVDDVSVHDNFFDLGGHSLLAVQLITQMENEFGVQIEFKELVFESLGQIASGVQQAGSA